MSAAHSNFRQLERAILDGRFTEAAAIAAAAGLNNLARVLGRRAGN